jgi:hypothetical protein
MKIRTQRRANKMKAIRVAYDRDEETVELLADAEQEEWVQVCEAFHDDVHRIRSVEDVPGYNALYLCYDDDNNGVYYLASEEKDLYRLKRSTFLKKLGMDKEG